MKPSTMKNKVKSAAVVFIWIIIWQILYLKVGKEVLVPSPLNTLQELCHMLIQPLFYLQILFTLKRVVIGVSLCFALGILTAVMSYFVKEFEIFIRPVLSLMKSTPIMAIIILAILWFESNEVPIFVCFLMCYPIVYTNVLAGLKALDQKLIEMSRIYKVKLGSSILKCYLPQLKPYLYSSADLALGMAWKVVIAAEVLAVPKYAIGYALMDAKRYLETTQVFAWIIAIVVLSELCQVTISTLTGRRQQCD